LVDVRCARRDVRIARTGKQERQHARARAHAGGRQRLRPQGARCDSRVLAPAPGRPLLLGERARDGLPLVDVSALRRGRGARGARVRWRRSPVQPELRDAPPLRAARRVVAVGRALGPRAERHQRAVAARSEYRVRDRALRRAGASGAWSS
jgi:hypothetical protein